MAFRYIDYGIQYTNVTVDLKSFTTLDSPRLPLLILPLGSVKFFLGAVKMIFHYYSITNIMRSHDW